MQKKIDSFIKKRENDKYVLKKNEKKDVTQ